MKKYSKEYLVKAQNEDVRFIYDVRNDELSRKNSINKDIIDYESHLKWYANKLSDKTSHIYLLTDGQTKFGHIIIDEEANNRVTISYYVSPQCRHKGYGTKLIQLAEEKIRQKMPNAIIQAEVLSENLISQKIFMKMQYKKIYEKDGIVFFEKR